MGGSGPPSNTWFPGPTQVLNPNDSSIGAAVFAGLTSVTDRPTDHANRSVRIGRIYVPVRSTAMRPNDNNNNCNTHWMAHNMTHATKTWLLLPLLLLYPFDGLFSKTTCVSRHQKGKPFWILLEQEIMGWQWHQLDHIQIICTSLQTDNHASTSPHMAISQTEMINCNVIIIILPYRTQHNQ